MKEVDKRTIITQPVVTIIRGKDPEVQEVNFACEQYEENFDEAHQEIFDKERSLEGFFQTKRSKKQKSMTTKSTMTNEDDYTTIHTTTPCTTPAGSLLDNDDMVEPNNEAIQTAHKIVGWKITPRVHFPPPNTLNASSLPTSEPRTEMLPQKDSKEFSSTIEPPYIHRPDRTLMVHQTKPIPLQPVKAWPGYGGNIYFQPFQIDAKPIGDRNHQTRSSAPRTSSYSGSRLDHSHAGTDSCSFSKYSSFYGYSPSLRSSKRPKNFSAKDQSCYETSAYSSEFQKSSHRQMARLDKNYILGLHHNGKLTEDLSWISGMDSLGTLKLGNPQFDIKRQSTNETYSRHTIIEKIPRNFVFHSLKRREHDKTVLSHTEQKIKSLMLQKYLKSYDVPDWAIKQVVEKFHRNERGLLRLPIIPLRIKGKKALVFDTSH